SRAGSFTSLSREPAFILPLAKQPGRPPPHNFGPNPKPFDLSQNGTTASRSCKRLKTKDRAAILGSPLGVTRLSIPKMILARTVATYLMYRFINVKRGHPDLELNLPGKSHGGT